MTKKIDERIPVDSGDGAFFILPTGTLVIIK